MRSARALGTLRGASLGLLLVRLVRIVLCLCLLTAGLAIVVPASGAFGDPVIAAAGDIACDSKSPAYNNGNGTPTDCTAKATAALLSGVDAVLPLGDEQYECGGLSAFNQSYDASWGQQKAITYPVPGDHEYFTSGGTDCSTNAAGYYGYFGSRAGDPTKGYYSYNLGSWHVIALNSQCSFVGGCGVDSLEEVWLKSDLAANSSAACILAYFHQPRFASSETRGEPDVGPFWQDLYTAGADVVLNGHDHWYERFTPQNPSGHPDPKGIREFIVGTGGDGLDQPLATRLPTSEVANNSSHGVLKLTLHPGSYDWNFVPQAGDTFSDTGSTGCHHGTSSTTSSSTTSSSTTTSSGTSTATTLTFAPTDDTYVRQDSPTATAGAATRLVTDGSPIVDSLLKFAVAGTSNCAVTGAKLLLTVGSTTDDNSDHGGDFHATGTNWSESTVTWNTAAPVNPTVIASLGSVALNTTYQVDVLPLIKGDGPVAVRISNTSGDGARYFSKEGSSLKAPQLQVTCVSAPSDTVAPTVPTNLTATAVGPSQVDLSWTASTDNVEVTGYRVYRNDMLVTPTPVSGTSYSDGGLAAATSYSYQVSAVDAAGNASPLSNPVNATTLPTPSTPSYRDVVLGTAGLVSYWRLGELNGTTAYDAKGTSNGTYAGGVTLGTPGAIANDPDTSVMANGSTGRVSIPNLGAATDFSIEGWTYLTNASTLNNTLYGTRGNLRLLARPGSPTNWSAMYAGAWLGGSEYVLQPASAQSNLNTWVHWVLTRSGRTLTLYRNGVQIGQRTDLPSTATANITGVIGAEGGTAYFLSGRVDEVAVYATALSATVVTSHYNLGTTR
jgi:hypothetical protein